MATPKNPSVFFVGLHDTNDLKRAILESTKGTITFMQKYENILKIHKEKNDAINDLKRLVKEISKLVSNLKQKLPESEIHKKMGSEEIAIEKQVLTEALEKRKNPAATKKETNTPKSEPVEKKQEIREPSEMEKLESQLKELENRLKGF